MNYGGLFTMKGAPLYKPLHICQLLVSLLNTFKRLFPSSKRVVKDVGASLNYLTVKLTL